jgi:amidophosphoribosyltransferase
MEWFRGNDQSTGERKSCSFERIYFSRGTDKEIYHERKRLGQLLAKGILSEVDHDLQNTVFSYIPNTAASAFYGLMEELNRICNDIIKDRIVEAGSSVTREFLEDLFKLKPRIEKVAVKDIKLRTLLHRIRSAMTWLRTCTMLPMEPSAGEWITL